jgi:alkanesulfonate monooxygenase SsuD/methylene tetrahydromethanopterin reductase-like flavin-dependent oxidoreductase (luciferase family)
LVEIGITAPNGVPGASRHDVLEWARRAERRGFSTLAVFDRLNDSLEPLTSLAAIAAVTEQIRLMTTVLVVLRRGHPAQLAQQVATVDRLSDGRLVLGVGLGGFDHDPHAAQISVPERGRRMAAQIEEMRRIWAGPANVGDRAGGPVIPGGGPDIFIGGHADGALQRSVGYAGWLSGNVAPDGFAQSVEKVRRGWRDAGRPGTPRFLCTQWFGLGDAAAENTEKFLRAFYHGFPDGFVDYSVQLAVNGEEEIRKTAAAFADAGCDELLLMPTTADPAEVDRLADVLAQDG